jgi:hypothetical protein
MLQAGGTMWQVALALGDTERTCAKHYAKYDLRSHQQVDELIAKA